MTKPSWYLHPAGVFVVLPFLGVLIPSRGRCCISATVRSCESTPTILAHKDDDLSAGTALSETLKSIGLHPQPIRLNLPKPLKSNVRSYHPTCWRSIDAILERRFRAKMPFWPGFGYFAPLRPVCPIPPILPFSGKPRSNSGHTSEKTPQAGKMTRFFFSWLHRGCTATAPHQ